MESIIINTSSLPSEARKFFHTRKVELREKDGHVVMLPVEKPPSLLGCAAGCNLTTERLMAYKAEDKKLEGLEE